MLVRLLGPSSAQPIGDRMEGASAQYGCARTQGLGKRHVPYGVLPAHYDVVGQALLATLEGGLGAEWNDQVRRAPCTPLPLSATRRLPIAFPMARPQVKASWTAVYGIIAKTMIGDNYPEA